MTISATLAPPKTKPWFKCTNENCDKKFQAYHGKVGCKCLDCDDVTPARMRQTNNV